MNLNDILKNMSEESFKNSLKKAQEFMGTPEGRRVAEKLKGANLGGAAGDAVQNPEQISQLDRDKLLKELAQNPDMIRQIEKILKG